MSIYEKAFGKYSKNLDIGIELIVKNNEYSYKHRQKKMFDEFAKFVIHNYKQITESQFPHICAHFRSHVYTERNGNSVITANSNYTCWARLMRFLIQLGYMPQITIPKGLKANHPLLKDSLKISCLGSMNPKLWKEELESKDFTELQAMNDEQYLNFFMEAQLWHRNHIVRIAREYILEASQRFADGRKYIADYKAELFNCSDLLHPYLLAPGSGQQLSLFSGSLPNNEGLKNLVGYLYHHHDGFVVRNFTGANNHLSRFCNHISLREHFGLSSLLSSACAIVIVNETGINAESLYRLKYNSETRTLTEHDTLDGYYFNYDKPRAGGPINRLIKRDPDKINTEYCFKLIGEMTAHFRNLAPKAIQSQLFIHDGASEQGRVEALSTTGFKTSFRSLISRSDNLELIASDPNLAKLRVTGGLLAWYKSGGDPRAAAKFLGNTTAVAIKNYIPKELQDFFYRKQIRSFQNLLISVATDKKSYQKEALGIKTVEALDRYLTNHVSDSELYKRVQKEKEEEEAIESNEPEITFVLSENNIAFLDAAKKSYENATSATTLKQLKKWADFAIIVFMYIRNNGTRKQQNIMVQGIRLNTNSPLILTQ
tara:strand:- start:23395 stop:25191 length:1797 start_codon:yes stop_codon:yes gene_type:complete